MELRYLSNNYVPKGQLEGFPLEIIDTMMMYQNEQGNEPNVKVFENKVISDRGSKGFTWSATKEGSELWGEIITEKAFDLFFEKYPKKEKIKSQFKPFDFSNGVKNHLDLIGKRIFSKDGNYVTVINQIYYDRDTYISLINGVNTEHVFKNYVFEDDTPVGEKSITKQIKMETKYFTFGQVHTHSINGHTLDKNCIVKITDENPRKTMMEIFGDKWSFEYTEEGISRHLNLFPKRIYDLKNNIWTESI